jgi:hypothetical protein
MVETMGLKIYHILMPFNGISSLPNLMKIYQSDSKDIQRSFVPKASNAFRSFLPYSKLHDLVTTVTSAKYCM